MRCALVPTRLAAAILAVGLTGCDLQHPKLPAELGGPWVVQQIAGASLGAGDEIYFEVNAATGEIVGYTGCNRFRAPMTSFGNVLTIGAIQEQPGQCASAAAATDKARFVGVLSSVRRYARHGKSLELLPQGSGEALLLLRVDNFANLTN